MMDDGDMMARWMIDEDSIIKFRESFLSKNVHPDLIKTIIFFFSRFYNYNIFFLKQFDYLL